MKKKALIALACLLACGTPALRAQQKAEATSFVVPADQQATKEDVLAFLDVTHARRNALAAMEMMLNNMKVGARGALLQQYPHASPGILKRVDEVFESSMKIVNVDELIPVMVPVYQKYLSHEDAMSLISFYSSPAGQHYLERMPVLIKESGEVSSKVVLTHMGELQAATQKGMDELEKYIKAHPDEVGTPAPSKE